MWLEELLARAALKARIMVLAHWASTAAAAAAAATATAAAAMANKDKNKAVISAATIVSGSSDSSSSSNDQKRAPLTLAAAISKLRNPLLAHPHRTVGNTGTLPLPFHISHHHIISTRLTCLQLYITLVGAGHPSGTGSDHHSLRQTTASGRILLALLDVLRCGLRTQALVTTLTTLQHTAMHNHTTLGSLICINEYRHQLLSQTLTYFFVAFTCTQHTVIGLLTPVDMQIQCSHAQSPHAPVQGQGLPSRVLSLPEWSAIPQKHEFWQATTLLSALRDESEITISFSDFCTVSLRVTSRCGVYITSVVKVINMTHTNRLRGVWGR